MHPAVFLCNCSPIPSPLYTLHFPLYTNSISPDDIRQQIELKVVELIKARLADGSITEERAQALSQIVLDTIKPGMSWQELYKAAAKLDDHAPELAPVVLPLMRQCEETIVSPAQNTVSNLIRQGQYDAATALAQKAINQDVQLVWQGAGKPGQQIWMQGQARHDNKNGA